MADNSTGQKTEEPTPKRKREAREKGQVAKSQELNQAFTLLSSFFVLYVMFSGMLESLMNKVTQLLTFSTIEPITKAGGYEVLMESIYYVTSLVAPVMIAAAVMGIIINFSQVGPLFTGESMKPKVENIDIIKGFKKIFSLKSLVEMIKAVLKIIIISVIAYIFIRNSIMKLVSMTEMGLNASLVLIGQTIFKTAIAIIIFLVTIGVFDFAYQKWEHKKSLKMTKYEVKQERKEMEGDPQLKQKRKEKQRQMSLNRMMTAMEDADVVITNPTHIAVALKFNIEEMEAPKVIAKGEGYIALKLKEKAKKLDIEIVENKPLARSLNKMCEIDDFIPEELFEAVAEILAYVYKKENRY
jgi:flagellar biosynthetic protein FlhB